MQKNKVVRKTIHSNENVVYRLNVENFVQILQETKANLCEDLIWNRF